jgi:hypothetical protein
MAIAPRAFHRQSLQSALNVHLGTPRLRASLFLELHQSALATRPRSI